MPKITLIDRLDDAIFDSPAYLDFLSSCSGLSALLFNKSYLNISAPLYLRGGYELAFLLMNNANNSKIIALLPLVISAKKIIPGMNVSLRRLQMWGDGDYYNEAPLRDVLVRSGENLSSIAQQFVAELQTRHLLKWDVILLTRVEPSNQFASALQHGYPNNTQSITTEYSTYATQFKPTTTAEDFWVSLKPKTRNLVRSAEKNMAKLAVVYRTERVEKIDDSILIELENIHSGRQKNLIDKGYMRRTFFEDAVEKTFFTAIIRQAASDNALDLHILRVNDDLVGFNLAITANAMSYHYCCAFDDSYKKLEVGRYLFNHLMAHLIDGRHCTLVLHGWGETSVKKEFSNVVMPLCDIHSTHSGFSSGCKMLIFKLLKTIKRILVAD